MGRVYEALKRAAEQNAAQQGVDMSAMPDAADMEYAQTAQKIATSGLPGVATIKSIGETGKTDAGVNKQYAIEVSIELDTAQRDLRIYHVLLPRAKVLTPWPSEK